MSFDDAASMVKFRTRGRIVDHLLQRGAVTADAAAPLPQRKRSDRAVLRRLMRKGVIIEGQPGHYHLNEPELDEQRAREKSTMTTALIAGGILTLASVFALLR